MLLLIAVGAKVIVTLGTDVIHFTTQVADLVTLREGEGRGGKRKRDKVGGGWSYGTMITCSDRNFSRL